MTSTWATRIAEDNVNHRLKLFFHVQGIQHIFQYDGATIPGSIIDSTRTRLKVITSLEQGETRLDLEKRRQIGGSLSIGLVDDDSGTLRQLFTPRRFRQAFLTNNPSAVSTSFTFSTTANFTDPDDLWIGGETISLDVTSATAGTATRGKYQSVATAHRGTSTDGAAVYTSPPNWIGRRVYLKGYLEDDAGNTSSSMLATLGTFRIESPPQHDGFNRWSIQCSELSDEFGSKKIYSGFEKIDLTGSNQLVASGAGQSTITLDNDRDYNQFVTGNVNTYVIAATNHDVQYSRTDTRYACWLLNGQLSNRRIEIETSIQYVTPWSSVPSRDLESIQHVAFLNGNAGKSALRVITSITGNATNGTYDVLPGQATTTIGVQKNRMGAGVLTAEVDNNSFINIGFGVRWFYVISEEADLADFLYEFCLITESMWMVSRSGLLKAKTLREDAESVVVNLDGTSIIGGTERIRYEEEPIKSRMRLQCNYDPLSGEYLVDLHWYDDVLQNRYTNREDSLEMKSKSIVVSDYAIGTVAGAITRDGIAFSELEARMRSVQGAFGRGNLIFSCTTNLSVLVAEVGDRVTVSATVPDMENGFATLAQKAGRIISMRPRYKDGQVDVEVQLLDKLFRIAASCVIASASGAVMTLRTTGFELRNAFPGRMFAIGQPVQIWDVSAGTYGQFLVTAATDTTVTLDGTPGFTIQNNVDFIRVDFQASQGDTANANGIAGTDYIYQMENNEYDIDAGTNAITRWR